jgi:hypothetical protein
MVAPWREEYRTRRRLGNRHAGDITFGGVLAGPGGSWRGPAEAVGAGLGSGPCEEVARDPLRRPGLMSAASKCSLESRYVVDRETDS